MPCLNTILRHIQTNSDKYDVCLLDNFIYCEILHRMRAAYGNEALTDISELVHGVFIQPSAFWKDYLKRKKDTKNKQQNEKSPHSSTHYPWFHYRFDSWTLFPPLRQPSKHPRCNREKDGHETTGLSDHHGR